MIIIKKTINVSISLSIFRDTYCSNMACYLSVKESDQLRIEDSFFISNTSKSNGVSKSLNKPWALHINANTIAIENIQFAETPGFVYKGISRVSMLFKNITCKCPKSHIHGTELENINLQVKHHNKIENDTVLTFQCIQCPMDHYRLGISSLTFMKISDLDTPYSNGECYKCPSGGICDGRNVVAHPNYWGFAYNDRLKFVFCSVGFCCQPGTCISYNGCNKGREGKLCTSCKTDFQLGMSGNVCLLKETCAEDWLYSMIVLSSLVYVGFLMAKVSLLDVLQQMYSAIMKRKDGKRSSYLTELTDLTNEVQPQTKVREVGDSQVAIDAKKWNIPFDHIEIFHVLVFHVQDTSLFQIRLPDMPGSSVQLQGFKEKLVSIVRLNSLSFGNQFACFPSGWTQINKILFEMSIIPLMTCIILFWVFLINVPKLRPNIQDRLRSSAYTVFLLIILFSSQRLSSYALNFIKCEQFGSARYLFIDTTVQCYQLWQFLVIGYVGLFILPFWLTLFLGPGLLASGRITVRLFLFGLMFPGPFAIYCIWLIHKVQRKPIHQTCHRLTTTTVLNEVWSSFTPFVRSNYFCWGGIVELRRLAIVFCATMISSPIERLVCMITVVIVAFAIHVRFHPYTDRIANACADISLGTMVMIGMVNVCSAVVDYSGGSFEYGDAMDIGKRLITFENILIEIYPLGVVVCCITYFFCVNLVGRIN